MSYNPYAAPPGVQPANTMGPPPGIDPNPSTYAASPSAPPQTPAQSQPPPNMPANFDFSAPVIRMGVPETGGRPSPASMNGLGAGPQAGRGSNAEPLGRRDRLGLGASAHYGGSNNYNSNNDGPPARNLDRERAALRESMVASHPPTREEVARTIFVGAISEGCPSDESLESLLRCAGKLRRWTRARDAEDKVCRFGFAEFEDVESLEAAAEIFSEGGLEVPLLANRGRGPLLKDEDGEVKRVKLLVVVDEQSRKYIDEWKGKRREDSDARQFRLDGCREDLRQTLTALTNAAVFSANADLSRDVEGDTAMQDGAPNGDSTAEIPTIPLALDDELADIPAEMRATVAEEIKAFRDRSTRRDFERLKREEELEQVEKARTLGASAGQGQGRSRLASSPPASAPSGPASAANGIPVGPRDRAAGINAPSGPKGYRGAQMPSDYVNGVAFVNGAGAARPFSEEEEDDSASDSELERHRTSKRDAELEAQAQDLQRRLQNRERTRALAQEREKAREEAEARALESGKADLKRRLAEWDDDAEARRGQQEYYFDREGWARRRGAFLAMEVRGDDRDRAEEARERGTEDGRAEERDQLRERDPRRQDTGAALPVTAPTTNGAQAFGGFKISLNSAAAARSKPSANATGTSSTQQPSASRRTLAEVEGLLEDEDDLASASTKRPELKPLPLPSAADVAMTGAEMDETERAAARRALASEIPTSMEELFAYPVKFSALTPEILAQQIRPFVEKKVVESLGVQEDLLVETVMEALGKARGAEEVVGELVEVFGEEEGRELVRRVWRVVVFWGESVSRGLV